MVVALVVAVLLVIAAAAAWLTVRRRPARRSGDAAERALQARAEQVAVQERMTRLHPDGVRDWMRPH